MHMLLRRTKTYPLKTRSGISVPLTGKKQSTSVRKMETSLFDIVTRRTLMSSLCTGVGVEDILSFRKCKM